MAKTCALRTHCTLRIMSLVSSWESALTENPWGCFKPKTQTTLPLQPYVGEASDSKSNTGRPGLRNLSPSEGSEEPRCCPARQERAGAHAGRPGRAGGWAPASEHRESRAEPGTHAAHRGAEPSTRHTAGQSPAHGMPWGRAQHAAASGARSAAVAGRGGKSKEPGRLVAKT